MLLATLVSLPVSSVAADDSGSVGISGTVRLEDPSRSAVWPARNVEVRMK